jgi:hypothetical protein
MRGVFVELGSEMGEYGGGLVELPRVGRVGCEILFAVYQLLDQGMSS